MTVSSDPFRNDYIGTGSVDTYSYGFRIFAESDLLVTQVDTSGIETTLVLNTDYTVTGVGAFSGGTIVLTGNLASGYGLTIRGVFTIEQQTDLRNQGGYKPETVEDALDYLTRLTQQQQDVLGRAIIKPETEAASALTLPTVDVRKNKFLSFDAVGGPIAASAVTGAPVTSFMETLLDDTDAEAGRATLGIVDSGFAAHAQTVPNMTVGLTAGKIYDPALQVIAEKVAQNTATFVAPTTNPRIDRIVVSNTDGTVSVIAGAEAASPVPPALTENVFPVAKVTLAVGMTEITDSLIENERPGFVKPAPSHLIAIKTADESVSSSTTVQDDDHLFFTLAANSFYELKCWLRVYAATGTPHFRYAFVEADGEYDTYVRSFDQGGTTTTASDAANESVVDDVLALNAATEKLMEITGWIRTGGSGGVFKLQWAQWTSDATATTVRAGSYMKVEKLN